MKANYVGWLLAYALALNVTTLQANDITIELKGKVVAKPCNVFAPKINVDLGPLNTFSFVSPGSASDWHNINLDLEDCPVGTSRVVATFSGSADSTGYYKNEGTAGNIQLELQDDKDTPLNSGVQKTVQVDNLQSAHFPLRVRALSVNGGATQGTIRAVINITYTYA